tara:strand:+ start:412 stop:963 length:552 start_codon:yes stop_codon:yes gene_type:complete
MSELRTNRIVPRDGLPAGSSGGIIQVKSVTKTDSESLTSNSTETLIPGLEVTITPTRSDSKILIMLSVQVMTGASFAGHYLVLKRNTTTRIACGDAAGNRARATFALGAPNTYDQDQAIYGPGNLSMTHLDSPATTSAVTYGLYHGEETSGTNALYVNRSTNDTDDDGYSRVASSITVMEISG